MADQLSPAIKREFEQSLGADAVVADAEQLAPHLAEWRGLFHGQADLLVRPADTEQASRAVRICAAHGIGVVPQGGNTGLVGGAIPHSTPAAPQIILSTSRLNRIRELDAENHALTAEAGCLLANVQAAAEEADRYFPLSLAAEGSCQLGGNISTNAGGINVLRYGNTRDLVLGLEVVLPDGSVFNGLRALRKDNAGYDLKQLFIGAEGTLGVITAATCKLFPRHRSTATAMLAVREPAAAVALYQAARDQLSDQLVAFELLNRLSMSLVLERIPGTRPPLAGDYPWFVLLEAGSGADMAAVLESFLGAQIDAAVVLDGVIAQSESQREELWRIRHSVSEAQKLAGPGIKHDVSVPVSRIPDFISRADGLVSGLLPGVRIVTFGHLGDGNLHYNLNQPAGGDERTWLDHRERVSGEVHSLVADLGGSFSAEHGVGSLKTGDLARFRAGVELSLMQTVKRALDPQGIMNPGKIFGSK